VLRYVAYLFFMII